MSKVDKKQVILDEILNSVQHLKKEKQSQIKYLKLIADSGFQISEMIENSLDMFKMEEKTYELDPSPCNLVEIFKKLSSDLNNLVRQKDLELLFYLNDQLLNEKDHSFWVSGEYRLLNNLFANLIKNAIEASPLSNQVRVDMDHQGENRAIIQIHNMGVVPENIRDRFFDRYTTSGKKSGTGLGTYSAKLITRTHQGDIRFETDEKLGTTLFVTLPAANKPEIDSHQTETSLVQEKISGAILIADDNLINQQVLKGLMEDHPIKLDMVENGKQAVEKVLAAQYDLILMDMEMPVMDGREAIQRIRQRYSHADLPIVALTAHNLELEDFNHTEHVINDIITKPIQPELLFSILRTYLVTKPSKETIEKKDQPDIEEKSQILNIDQALRQLMGKRSLLETVMTSFRNDHSNAHEIVKQLIESDQLETAQRKVHSIKGLAGTIGARSLQKIGNELETALKKKMQSKFDSLLVSFQKSLEPVIEEIDKILPDKDTPEQQNASISSQLSNQLDALEKNMKYLRDLLADCDSEANDACNECLPALDYLTQNSQDRSLLDELKNCLKNYLFDDATRVLEEICQKLGLKIAE